MIGCKNGDKFCGKQMASVFDAGLFTTFSWPPEKKREHYGVKKEWVDGFELIPIIDVGCSQSLFTGKGETVKQFFLKRTILSSVSTFCLCEVIESDTHPLTSRISRT